jgi:oligoendopeptidase F
MPRPDVQQPIIAEFRQRVFDAREHRNLSSQEIEQLVWGEIEEEFLNRPPQDYEKKNGQ